MSWFVQLGRKLGFMAASIAVWIKGNSGEGGLEALEIHKTRIHGCSHTDQDFKGARELQETARTP